MTWYTNLFATPFFYILVCTDCLSAKIFAWGVTKKTGAKVAEAFQKIVKEQNDGRFPANLAYIFELHFLLHTLAYKQCVCSTDMGSEFISTEFKNVCQERRIHWIRARGEIKSVRMKCY